MAYTKFRSVTINHLLVPNTDRTNFTFPVWGTVASLAAVASGGLVTTNAGAGIPDIAFFSDAGLTTPLKFERVVWVSTSGKHLFYVKVPSVSHTIDTVIYMAYGNSAIVADPQDAVNAWDANWKEVWHLGDGTTLSLIGSILGSTLTNVGAATHAAGPNGQSAAQFSGAQHLDLASAIIAGGVEPMAVDMMILPSSSAGSGDWFNWGTSNAAGIRSISQRPNNGTFNPMRVTWGVALDQASATGQYSTSVWNHVGVASTSSSYRDVKPNGAALTSSATNTSAGAAANQITIGARRQNGATNNFATGLASEIRISNVLRAEDERTAYASSLTDATFFALGAEQSAGANTAPTAAITSPVAGGGSTSVVYGSSVTFAGTGTDTEDGTLTGASLVWSSNLQGQIGTGTGFSLSTLLAGTHTITLTATDSGSLTGTATITLTITSTVQTANQSFIAANGGDAAWLGVADCRVNVTDDGSGKASQWDDVRGPGTGKLIPLTQATQAKRYAITANGLVGTAAAQSHMLSALDARLVLTDATPLHFFVIARSPSGASFLLGMSQDPTDATSLPYQYLTTAAANYGMQMNIAASGVTGLATLDTGTAFDATPRAIIYGHEATGFNGQWCAAIHVRGRQGTRRTNNGSPVSTGSGMKLALGRWGTTYADLTILWIGVTNQTRSAALDAAFEAFATAQFGVAPDLSKRGTIIRDGVSTNRGHNTTHPAPTGGDNAANTGATASFYLTERRQTGVGTFAALGYEDDASRVLHAVNGRFVVDQTNSFAFRAACDIDRRRGGAHIYFLGSQLGALMNPAWQAAGGDVLMETAITNFVATLRQNGYSVIGETVNDYFQYYTPTTTGTLNQIGANAKLLNAWYRTTFLTLPGVIGLLEYELSAGDFFRIDRKVVLGTATNACEDAAYLDASSHPTDLGHQLLSTVEKDWFDLHPRVLVDNLHGGLGPLPARRAL